MTRRDDRAGPTKWLATGVFVVLICGAACFSASFSLAQVIEKRNINLAYFLAPYDGRIAALKAASLAHADATNAERLAADRLARDALKKDPTAVVAVSTLGIDAQLRGDTATARRVFSYSQRLSRRDLQTQLWAIEDAVGRGDVAAALRHYDIALRTTPTAEELLFPILTSAVAQSDIRGQLVKTLVGKPRWGEGFINYAAVHGPDPRTTIHLFATARGAGIAISAKASASLVNALIAKGFFDEAWRYYSVTRNGGDRRRSRDARFANDPEVSSSLDWMPVSGDGISTSIQNSSSGGIFEFAAAASVGGPLLKQVQILPPGTYQITGYSQGIDQSSGAEPYWVLTCSDGRELGRVDVGNSTQANGRFSGRITVPSGCPVQTLMLVARPSDKAGGLSGQINQIQLYPVH